MKKCSRSQWLIFAAVALLLFVIPLFGVPMGDDFIWYYSKEWSNFERFSSPNGRYLGNLLTYWMVRYPIPRLVLYVGFGTLLLCTMTKCLHIQKKNVALAIGSIFTLLYLMPASMFLQTIGWRSAFCIYVVAAIGVVTYFILFWGDIDGTRQHKGIGWGVLGLLLGFAGSLCVENVTLYAGAFAVFALIYAWRQKKLRLYQGTYLLGTAIGAVWMFLHPAYGLIANANDLSGKRGFEWDFSNIYMTLYRDVVPIIAIKYLLIHLVIAAALGILYYRADKSAWTKERRRYAVLSMMMVVLFLMLSFCDSCLQTLVELSWSMRVRAVEGALTMLYYVALLYLLYVLLPKESRVKAMVYLCSTVVLLMPLVVVQPINERCAFPSYCLWILVAGTLTCEAGKRCSEKLSMFLTEVIAAVSIGVTGYLSVVWGTNYYVNAVRVPYLKEQLLDNKKRVELVALPYSSYNTDAIALFGNYGVPDIKQSLISFYQLPDSLLDVELVEIDIQHFNTDDLSVHESME